MNLSFVASFITMLFYWVLSLSKDYGSALVMFVLTMIFMGMGIFQALAKSNKKKYSHLKLVK